MFKREYNQTLSITDLGNPLHKVVHVSVLQVYSDYNPKQTALDQPLTYNTWM